MQALVVKRIFFLSQIECSLISSLQFVSKLSRFRQERNHDRPPWRLPTTINKYPVLVSLFHLFSFLFLFFFFLSKILFLPPLSRGTLEQGRSEAIAQSTPTAQSGSQG
jgi:hypothetical protein